jgi:hypothetical protein
VSMQQLKMAEPNIEERRTKVRFPVQRELRFKVLKNNAVIETGVGRTLNLSSGGVAFYLEKEVKAGAYIELSISWPVLLEASTPMRFIVFGRVLRSSNRVCACTVEKYEFRTQARSLQAIPNMRVDSKLQRWADGLRRETTRAAVARA